MFCVLSSLCDNYKVPLCCAAPPSDSGDNKAILITMITDGRLRPRRQIGSQTLHHTQSLFGFPFKYFWRYASHFF